MRWVMVVVVAAAALTWSAQPAGAAGAAVDIINYNFQPSSVTITPGASVVWTMRDAGTQHTVTADDGSFDSSSLLIGQTFSHTFAQSGTVAYHCKLHPNMKGAVIVEEAGASTSTSTTATAVTRATTTTTPKTASTTFAAGPGAAGPTTSTTLPVISVGTAPTIAVPGQGKAKTSELAKEPPDLIQALTVKAVGTLLLLLITGSTIAVTTRPTRR